jgi:hypothetical protein
MIAIGTLGAVWSLLTAGPTKDGPAKSADVVQVALEQGSIADGLESFYVKLTVARGWHVYANPVGKKTAAAPATVVEFLLDGNSVDYDDVYYPKGVARTGANGKEYRAYKGTVYFTGWLVYPDTRDAQVISVRVRVVATDGKRHLKESVIVAELQWPKKKQGDCVCGRQPPPRVHRCKVSEQHGIRGRSFVVGINFPHEACSGQGIRTLSFRPPSFRFFRLNLQFEPAQYPAQGVRRLLDSILAIECDLDQAVRPWPKPRPATILQ